MLKVCFVVNFFLLSQEHFGNFGCFICNVFRDGGGIWTTWLQVSPPSRVSIAVEGFQFLPTRNKNLRACLASFLFCFVLFFFIFVLFKSF